MIIRPVLTPSGKVLFKIRSGQVALGALMLGLVLGLIVWSFASFQTHDRTQETVLAEESDASALVFTQRESFGLVVELEGYLLGQSTNQDVLLARSTLAQRLNVITSTGQSTYEVAGEPYRAALDRLDQEIGSLKRGPQSDSLASATQEFLTATRQLSERFQDISRENIQLAVADRALIDFWQGTISLFALSIGLVLFLWVVRDLVRGFSTGYQELDAKTLELNRAREDFLAIQALDEKVADWTRRLDEGGATSGLIAEINENLSRLSSAGSIALSEEGELSFGGSQISNGTTAEVQKLLETRLNELIGHLQRQSKAKRELDWERNHDHLTGLLNRRGMTASLQRKFAHPNGGQILLIDIDIDGFTAMNNSLGQRAGDELLRTLASRLSALGLHSAALGRIAADEFGVILTVQPGNASDVVRRVSEATRFDAEGFSSPARVTGSIGWHLAVHDERPEDAAAKAGAALKHAKSLEVPGSITKFNAEVHAPLMTSYLEQLEFREALLSGAVVPYLQPIVDLMSRQTIGYEVLARWNHHERGVLSAYEFIPIATQGGLLDELFECMLEETVKHFANIKNHDGSRTVSVNVDPKTLRMSDFVGLVQRTLKRHQAPPSWLVLEVTEQSLIDDESIERLNELRALGISISLDDFGTGYSSLSRLTALPINILKLDRSFISSGLDDKTRDMLKTIRDMAAASGMKVTVEGIEDESMAGQLADLGFHFGQGYLFGRPAPLGSQS